MPASRASKRARAGALGLAIPLLCGALLSCSGGDEPLPPGERFARRYLPPEADWRRESEIPSSPPKSPSTVIWEVSRFDPDKPTTPEQRGAADDFVERCFEVAERNRWFEFERGRADGFGRMVKDRRHFRNLEYVLDDRILDPERPEFLMYEPVPGGGRILTGFMFLPRKPDERVRCPAALARWRGNRRCRDRGLACAMHRRLRAPRRARARRHGDRLPGPSGEPRTRRRSQSPAARARR